MNTDNKINNPDYLVDRFLKDIVRFSLVYVHNMDDAEDIAQQVFLTYLHKSPVFNDEQSARNWLFCVTANKAKNYIRSRKNYISFDDLSGVLSTCDNDFGHTELEEAVLNAVLQLKSVYREVIHLYYYNDYDTNEIAKILGVPPATVRSRLRRARAILEQSLKGGKYREAILQRCDKQNNG